VSVPNDAGTPAPAERTAAAPESAPDDAGTLAPAERTAQVRRETPGPHAARSEVRGPRAAQQGSPGTVPVYGETCK